MKTCSIPLSSSFVLFLLLVAQHFPSGSADHVRGSTSSPKQKKRMPDHASTTTTTEQQQQRSLKKKQRKKKQSKAKAKGLPHLLSNTERSGLLDLSEVAIGEEDDVVEEIELQFMADEDSVATFTDLEKVDDLDIGAESWLGTNDDGETFTYIKSTSPETGEKYVTGSMLNKDGVSYSFWGREGETAEVLETFAFEDEIEVVAEDRPEVMDGGEFGEELPSDEFWESRRLAVDDTSHLDVLVIYTPETARALGNPGNVKSHVDSTLAWSNLAMKNSGISTRFRLAGGKPFAVTDYDRRFSESGRSWGGMLSDLRGRTDGTLDFVHGLRDQVNADFVSMIVAKSGACGIGFVNQNPTKNDDDYAFSICRYSCSTTYLSFVHEIGHNMGLNHDRRTKGHTNSRSYPSPNYGYQDPSRRFRTVLAYDCPNGGCTRQPVFSGSNNDWRGTRAGDRFNDNAKYIMQYLHVYADWRISNDAGGGGGGGVVQPPVRTTPPPTPATRNPTPSPTPQPGNSSPSNGFFIHCNNADTEGIMYYTRKGNLKQKDCNFIMSKVRKNKWNKVNSLCDLVDVTPNHARNGQSPKVWQTCQKECSLSGKYLFLLFNANRSRCPYPVSG